MSLEILALKNGSYKKINNGYEKNTEMTLDEIIAYNDEQLEQLGKLVEQRNKERAETLNRIKILENKFSSLEEKIKKLSIKLKKWEKQLYKYR